MPVRAIATILLLALAGAPPTGTPPELSAAYPNPAFPNDAGEFVVIDVPDGTQLSAYELRDGEDAVRLPNVRGGGTVAIARNGTAARLAGYRVIEVPSFLSLSNAGETITLNRVSDGRVVDTLSYPVARTAELQTDGGAHPIGATTHDPVTAANVPVTSFVLPDDARPVQATIDDAETRLYLAGYTLTSSRVRDALLGATARGVDVRVLLDGSPVGGDSPAQVALLDDLAAAGIDVRLVGGPRSRYAFHHSKYAVVDDEAVVLTENWKASGTGGHGNRGWGLVVHDADFADALAGVFESDADWVGVQQWPTVREPASGQDTTPANETYARRFPAQQLAAETVTLAVTPDNAEPVVVGFIENATRSLRVQQVRLGSGRLQRHLVHAAERGVTVEILLSGKWYVRDENQLLADCLNGYAERASIPLTVRIVEPRSRFEKVHAKVAIADGERVLLGSLNWNEYALDRNREVLVVTEGDAIGEYYGRVFQADWRGGAWRISLSLVGAAILSVSGLLWFLRHTIEFSGRPETPESRVKQTGDRVWADVDPSDGSAIDAPTTRGVSRTTDAASSTVEVSTSGAEVGTVEVPSSGADTGSSTVEVSTSGAERQ